VDNDDDDDGPPLQRPRLSLPIEDDDDYDEDEIHPHRSQVLDDDNFTMQSIEMPRRALNEQASRPSFALGRMSDYYGNLDDEDPTYDPAFFPPMDAIDEDAAENAGGMDDWGREEISYAQFDADERRNTGRESDFGIIIPQMPEANESTFMMNPDTADSPRPEPNEPFEELFEPIGEQSDVHFEDDVMDGGQDGHQLESEPELEDEEVDIEMEAATANGGDARSKSKRKPGIKVSRHGIEYKSLPPATVKRLAQTFAKTSGVKGKISPDALTAIMQASEWFFEQLGDDLGAFAKHAGRKTIDESDMLQVMRRYVIP
jgi:histone H3/H4